MGVIKVFDGDGNEYDMEVEEGDPGPTDRERTPAEWAKLRRAEKAARDRQAEKDLADRQLAFYRAGINPDDPKMGYFVKGYDGDLDPGKVKEAAVLAGFLAADGPTQSGPVDPTATEVDRASHEANRAISGAAAGATPDQRSPVAGLIEAHASGGRDALIDRLREAGVPIQYDSQQ